MNRLELLTTQPDFPNEDLSDTNVPYMEYYLSHIRAEVAHAEMLRQSLRVLHATGHQALRVCGIDVTYSEQEYGAFCNGFAAAEYIQQLVNPREYDGTLAVVNTQELLINSGELAEFEIADHYKTWLESHPNTYGVVVDTGAQQGETMRQLHARSIGAHIACGLQMIA